MGVITALSAVATAAPPPLEELPLDGQSEQQRQQQKQHEVMRTQVQVARDKMHRMRQLSADAGLQGAADLDALEVTEQRLDQSSTTASWHQMHQSSRGGKNTRHDFHTYPS